MLRPPSSWILRTLIAGQAILLPALLFLQYRWTSEIARAESIRAQAHRTAAVSVLAQDIDDEATRVYAGLQLDLGTIVNARWDAYAHRLASWKRRVPSARMVGHIWIVALDRSDSETVLEWSESDVCFRAVSWPPALSVYRSKLPLAVPPFVRLPKGYVEEIGGFVAPLFAIDAHAQPQLFGYVIAEVLAGALRNNILPALIEHAFGCELANCGYRFEVLSREQPARTLFRIPEDSVVAQEPPVAEVTVFRIQPGLRRFALEAVGPGANPGVNFEVYRVLQSADTSQDNGAWILRVTPRATGSAGMSSRLRGWNMSLGFIMVLLLGANGYLLYRLACRSRDLAAMQTGFLAGVSHDLRTPLTVLRSAGENLVGGYISGPSKIEEYGRMIRAESERLQIMVDQVLEFARREGRHQANKRVLVPVQEIVSGALADCECEIERLNTKVNVTLADSMPEIWCDPEALRQMMRNLIVNALKYNRKGGAIHVSASRSADSRHNVFLELWVHDEGDGIPVDEQERIFEPFFRLPRSRAAGIPGTGLGLYLVKQIAKEHRGTVTIESAAGHGSCFIVRLPIAEF
jgi:signal transduction histidine kinase